MESEAILQNISKYNYFTKYSKIRFKHWKRISKKWESFDGRNEKLEVNRKWPRNWTLRIRKWFYIVTGGNAMSGRYSREQGKGVKKKWFKLKITFINIPLFSKFHNESTWKGFRSTFFNPFNNLGFVFWTQSNPNAFYYHGTVVNNYTQYTVWLETIIPTGITCKKIPCSMRDSACGWCNNILKLR